MVFGRRVLPYTSHALNLDPDFRPSVRLPHRADNILSACSWRQAQAITIYHRKRLSVSRLRKTESSPINIEQLVFFFKSLRIGR